MRIAVVHSFYSGDHPSGETANVELQVGALRRAGHEVVLVALRTDEEIARPLFAARAAVRTSTGFGASPLPALRDFRPDIVHIHNTFPNFGSRWIERWPGRVVLTLHNSRTVCAAGTLSRNGETCTSCINFNVVPGVLHKCYRNSALATLPVAIGASKLGGLRHLIRAADSIVTLNQTLRDTIGQLTSQETFVIPNFVPSAPQVSNRDLGWTFVGRVSEEKGLQALLPLWGRSAPLQVIGDGPLMPQLRTQFAELSNVTWHGLLDHGSTLALIGRSRGLVIPSLCAEGLPTVILEALARGVPVAASKQVAVASLLEQEGVAVTISMGDESPDSLHGRLNALLSAPGASPSHCREVHRRYYSEERWVSEIEAVYERTLG